MTTILSEILFEDNPLKVCYSGQLLRGVAKICFPAHTSVRAIYMKFIGEGCYSWVDDISDREKTGSYQYFDERKYLVPRSSASIHVTAGSNRYPFEVQLPSNLSTSYEGTYGHVRYTMALHIVPAGKRLDPNPVIELFTVIKPLNLNNESAYILPIEAMKVAHFSFGFTRLCVLFWWKSGVFQIFGRLPVSGYCSGQIMNLKLDVLNRSGQGVLIVLVHFIKEVTYNARDGSKKIEKITLIKRKIKGFNGNETGIQSKKINLTVPSLPPTSFQSTNDVCIFKYKLRVTAVCGLWLHEDPILEIPVVIGSYPITNEMYQTVSRELTQPLFASAPPEPILTSAPEMETYVNSDNCHPYPDTDLPTYEEAVLTETSTDKLEFSPKYPVYNKATTYCTEDVN